MRLDASANTQSLDGELGRAIGTLGPSRVLMTRAGDHRVQKALEETAETANVPLEVLEDETFTCSLAEFDAWADDGRNQLVMEYFYRERRRALEVLLDDRRKPVGGNELRCAEPRVVLLGAEPAHLVSRTAGRDYPGRHEARRAHVAGSLRWDGTLRLALHAGRGEARAG